MGSQITIVIFFSLTLDLRQVVDKYLVQDRSNGGVYETPQFMYIMIALTIFREYPKARIFSLCQKILRRNLKAPNQHSPPIMGGVRTPLRQFASCVLVDVDDTLDSIFSSDMDYRQICCTKGRNRYQRGPNPWHQQ